MLTRTEGRPTGTALLHGSAATTGDDPDFQKLLVLIYRNLSNLDKLVHNLDNAGEYRCKQFEAMGSLELFDLVVLFGSDMSEDKV